MAQAIELENVTKVYRGKVWALRGVSLRVGAGEIFGLLGPNGAGKTTLVKIITSIVHPTNARGTVLGRRIGHKPTLARVGYLPENHRLPRYLTGQQAVEFFSALSGLGRNQRRRRCAELLEQVGMARQARRKTATYSKGMSQRVGLAQALAHDPELLLLDEPTDGVDPEGRRDIRQILLGLRQQGKTVFVNSHLLSELEMICDRVAILVDGAVSRQGTLDELTLAQQRYEIELSPVDGRQRSMVAAALPGVFGQRAEASITVSEVGAPGVIERGHLANGAGIELENHVLRIDTSDPAQVQPILDKLRAAGLIIRRLQLMRPSLEDLFMQAVATPRSNAAGGSP